MKKYVFFIVFFLLFAIVLFATGQTVKETGNVNGVVKDEATGEIIDFAGVSIYKTETENALKNFMTDPEGKFSFNDLPFGSYKIKVSFMGYQAKTVEDIVINANDQDIKVDIKLTPNSATVLEEVVVKASKPVVEFGADTITFNVDQSVYAQGSTATDLLKTVPMVTVDPDGKPSIAGKVNTRVFIDGKPSDYTSETLADLLTVLPSEAIQKIEVITNPEARYSADGDGIINIVLKKGYSLGLSSGLSYTLGTLGDYNGTAYSAFSNKKITVNGSYSFKHAPTVNGSDLARTNYNSSSSISSYMNQNGSSKNETDSHNARASLNWDITPLQNLRTSVNYNTNNGNGSSLLDDYRFNASQVQTQFIDQNILTNNSGNSFTFNADYTLRFKRRKGQSLSAGLTFFVQWNLEG